MANPPARIKPREHRSSSPALEAALTAHCCATGLAARPTATEHPVAAHEGWTHLPLALPEP